MPVALLGICLGHALCVFAGEPLYVFNSDGGAAAIAHIKGEVTRDVVCHELDELEGTAVTDFFWCPIVGGNVFIYPTNVGERMGDNIRDWEQVHPYYRQQGQAMADNLAQLVARGEDPIDMLVRRARELKIRFWLTCRMNEIHEDDDRFTVLRSLFKEEHPELLHGKNYHPEAVYAPKKGWSYAWDYSQEGVRQHFLALFEEWLQYDVDGIELDFVRSPCLFPPGKEKEGMPLLTDFVVKLRARVDAAARRRQQPVKLAVRVPPSLQLCRAAGIDIKVWMERRLVDQVTPMDRGYLHPEPRLSEFVKLGAKHQVTILGGIEPKVTGYRQSNRQTFALASTFLHQGADGLYLFNYDCHRSRAKSSQFGGVLQDYTAEELEFLKHGVDRNRLRDHDKQYLVSHDRAGRLAGQGGMRPLPIRLPVGKLQTFTLNVGDDLNGARTWKRIRSSRLVIALHNCVPQLNEVVVTVNGVAPGAGEIELVKRKSLDEVVVTLVNPAMKQGPNEIEIGLKAGGPAGGQVHMINWNLAYGAAVPKNDAGRAPPHQPLPVLGAQQLFAYMPQSLEIYIKEPRHVREPSDWPANLLRFQFPESVNAYDPSGRRLWEFSFETSQQAWRVTSKAEEKSMGGIRKNRVMECVDTVEGAAVIQRSVTWSDQQIDFQLHVENRGDLVVGTLGTSMCLQRTAAPDYLDRGNQRTFLVSDRGFVPSRELVFHPQSLMFYSQVGTPLEVVDGAAPCRLEESCLLVLSADQRYVLCYGWRDATMVFMNRSGRVRCLHSEFRYQDLAPGQTFGAEGVLFVQKGGLEQAYQRFQAWKRREPIPPSGDK